MSSIQPKPAEGNLAGRWEWEQLANAASCRFGQDAVLWTIIGSFWSTNAVLLVALFATGTLPESREVPIIVGTSGLVISFLWMIMQAAALRRVVWYEEVMRQLEDVLGIDMDKRLISGPDLPCRKDFATGVIAGANRGAWDASRIC